MLLHLQKYEIFLQLKYFLKYKQIFSLPSFLNTLYIVTDFLAFWLKPCGNIFQVYGSKPDCKKQMYGFSPHLSSFKQRFLWYHTGLKPILSSIVLKPCTIIIQKNCNKVCVFDIVPITSLQYLLNLFHSVYRSVMRGPH